MKNSRMEGLWNKNKTMKAKAKILFIGTISWVERLRTIQPEHLEFS
jgi:hypothetical protein